MSFHLADYTVAIGTTANTDVPALQDDILTIINSHFQLRAPMDLVKASVLSATLLRARLDSPTMRFFGNPFVRPVVVGATWPTNPNVMHMFEHPMHLPAGEEIAIQATSGIAMGTERLHALITLMDVPEPIPAGTPFAVRFTGTATATANSWTTITFTMDQALPVGMFDMIMSECQGTTQIAHRWLFDQQQWRPGFASLAALGSRMTYEDYMFRYGKMGSFLNTSLPRLQILCTAADTAQEGYMWIIPRGRGTTPFSISGAA